MSNKFSLKIFDLFWLGDEKDYHEDFCLHGRVQAIIGDEILDDGLNDDLDEWTVSAGAFRMLQSIYSDHYSGKEEHLLPCCGHFMFINDKMDELAILGCPNGIDWNIKHIGNDVVLKSAKGTMVTLPLEEYKGVIFDFADAIEDVYKKSAPKKLHEECEQKAYERFWQDWHKLRNN